MKFDELHEHIPLARYGKAKSLTMEPYKGIVLAMPGRHAEDTTPKGGDFVVMVTDKNLGWKKHQFKHDDIFKDIEARTVRNIVMEKYLDVIAVGTDPDSIQVWPNSMDSAHEDIDPQCMSVRNFLHAVQCLAVAEHRRYSKYEDKFGGRFLPFRFAAGIAEGLWTAEDAIEKQRFGRPAVERMEKKFGVPALTKKLME